MKASCVCQPLEGFYLEGAQVPGRTIALIGDSGSGKTTQIGEAAKKEANNRLNTAQPSPQGRPYVKDLAGEQRSAMPGKVKIAK